MTGLVLADATVIAGGFADSLGQFFASPWVIVPAAVALAMFAAGLRLKHRTRITHLVFLPPLDESAVSPCPWCDDAACADPDRCDCAGACGRYYCKAVTSA